MQLDSLFSIYLSCFILKRIQVFYRYWHYISFKLKKKKKKQKRKDGAVWWEEEK